MQRENDILHIDRLKKSFNEIEHEIAASYIKKCKQLKEAQEKRKQLLAQKIDIIIEKARQIEDQVLPDFGRIAEDEDNIEFLKGKKEILKEVKRNANEIKTVEIEEQISQKLIRVQLKSEEPCELIEQHKVLLDIETDVSSVDKQVS